MEERPAWELLPVPQEQVPRLRVPQEPVLQEPVLPRRRLPVSELLPAERPQPERLPQEQVELQRVEPEQLPEEPRQEPAVAQRAQRPPRGMPEPRERELSPLAANFRWQGRWRARPQLVRSRRPRQAGFDRQKNPLLVGKVQSTATRGAFENRPCVCWCLKQ